MGVIVIRHTIDGNFLGLYGLPVSQSITQDDIYMDAQPKVDRWGTCPHCQHSYTGSYCGTLHCVRCERKPQYIGRTSSKNIALAQKIRPTDRYAES